MIVFKNNGLLDLHAITTFGASVKEGKNPIGQFGTGLKYAIAVLLRHGCGVTIAVGETQYSFGTRVQSIREKDFALVHMFKGQEEVGTPCGFTTELGKHWELWMAYREIACNCMDEDGAISKEDYAMDAEAGSTIITVTGAAFADVWQDRAKYILEAKPHLSIPGVMDVRMQQTQFVYYRGVRVYTMDSPTMCEYNFTRSMDLTEDRTLGNSYMVPHYVQNQVMQSDNADWIRRVILAPKGSMESVLDFRSSVPLSDTFKRTVMDEYRKNHLGPNVGAVHAVRMVEKAAFRPAIRKITPVQDKTLVKAIAFCAKLGFDVAKYPIHVVETLGESTLAMAMENEIWLSERIFQLGGTKAVASTLIEEFLHLDRNLLDESRAMQQFLFDKIVSMGEDMLGEPL